MHDLQSYDNELSFSIYFRTLWVGIIWGVDFAAIFFFVATNAAMMYTDLLIHSSTHCKNIPFISTLGLKNVSWSIMIWLVQLFILTALQQSYVMLYCSILIQRRVRDNLYKMCCDHSIQEQEIIILCLSPIFKISQYNNADSYTQAMNVLIQHPELNLGVEKWIISEIAIGW